MHNSLDLVVLALVIITACAIDTLGPEARAKALKKAESAASGEAPAPQRSLRSYAIAAAVAVGVLLQLSMAAGTVRAAALN